MIIDLLLTQDLQSSRSSSCSTVAPRKGWRRSTSQNLYQHLQAMKKDDWLTSVWIQPKRCIQTRVKQASQRWRNASNCDANTSSWELTHSNFTANRPNLTKLDTSHSSLFSLSLDYYDCLDWNQISTEKTYHNYTRHSSFKRVRSSFSRFTSCVQLSYRIRFTLIFYCTHKKV